MFTYRNILPLFSIFCQLCLQRIQTKCIFSVFNHFLRNVNITFSLWNWSQGTGTIVICTISCALQLFTFNKMQLGAPVFRSLVQVKIKIFFNLKQYKYDPLQDETKVEDMVYRGAVIITDFLCICEVKQTFKFQE